MNIKLLKKLQKARRTFLDESIVKSGTNNFKHFRYWELKDLIPLVQTVCEELEMETAWGVCNGRPCLHLYDFEQGDDQEPITVDLQQITVEGNSMMQMQDVGGVETYTKRYLICKLFNIVENDIIESKIGEPVKKAPTRKPQPTKPKPQPEQKPDQERISQLANEIGDRLYQDGRKSITKPNVAKECDKMIREGIMTRLEKREVVNLVN